MMQTRESAQNAKDELNGIMLRDNELRIGWGKAVTIPPTALAATPIPIGLAALAAAKGASVPPPGMAASLPWANAPQEAEKKPHDGNGTSTSHQLKPHDGNVMSVSSQLKPLGIRLSQSSDYQTSAKCYRNIVLKLVSFKAMCFV